MIVFEVYMEGIQMVDSFCRYCLVDWYTYMEDDAQMMKQAEKDFSEWRSNPHCLLFSFFICLIIDSVFFIIDKHLIPEILQTNFVILYPFGFPYWTEFWSLQPWVRSAPFSSLSTVALTYLMRNNQSFYPILIWSINLTLYNAVGRGKGPVVPLWH